MKLIDKDAVLAEIESLLDKGKYHEEYDCAYRDGNNGALYALKGRINTLEVKEVDLEKESLTWKDIGTIDQLLWDLSGEHNGKLDNEGYYKAVLSKYKAQKG